MTINRWNLSCCHTVMAEKTLSGRSLGFLLIFLSPILRIDGKLYQPKKGKITEDSSFRQKPLNSWPPGWGQRKHGEDDRRNKPEISSTALDQLRNKDCGSYFCVCVGLFVCAHVRTLTVFIFPLLLPFIS